MGPFYIIANILRPISSSDPCWEQARSQWAGRVAERRGAACPTFPLPQSSPAGARNEVSSAHITTLPLPLLPHQAPRLNVNCQDPLKREEKGGGSVARSALDSSNKQSSKTPKTGSLVVSPGLPSSVCKKMFYSPDTPLPWRRLETSGRIRRESGSEVGSAAVSEACHSLF